MQLTRLIALLAGLVTVFQGARFIGAVDDSCVQSCDDDGPDGRCPPDCGDCACCAHPAPVVPALTMTTIQPAAPHDLACISVDELPASIDPAEVFHIPKSARV